MTLDSRACVVEKEAAPSLYSSGGPTEDMSEWIQPSIVQQVIDPTGSTIVDGLYVQTPRPKVIPTTIEPDLALELEAWEAASDEALMLFEAGCT